MNSQNNWVELGVEKLLPHAPPMRLIDQVFAINEESVQAAAVVTSGRSFTCDSRGLPWWVSIELMAQTIGLWAGARSLERGMGLRLGFLLGTRKLESNFSHLAIGEQAIIEADLNVLNADGLAVFDCTLTAGQKSASARLKVFQPDNLEEYLGIEQ